MRTPTACPVFLAGLLLAAGSASAQEPAEVRALIQQLGSASLAAREETQARLLKSEQAIPYVKEAIRNERPAEIRTRCARILEQRKLLMRDDILRQLDGMRRRGEIARACATAYEWRYVLREKLRDFEVNAAQSLATIVEKKTGRRPQAGNSRLAGGLVSSTIRRSLFFQPRAAHKALNWCWRMMCAAKRFEYYRSVARIGLQTAEALSYAHLQGVLHRDIKPSNLLLDVQETAWITDFGLAKAEGTDELTHAGNIVGTIRFMASGRC